MSSTWTDLQSERSALADVLHRMHECTFVGMEYFGSSGESTLAASLAALDSCDVYVGIIGHRYGSGITEREYRRARDNNLPCLLYTLRDNGSPESHEERLQSFTQAVRAAHLVTEVADAGELAVRVSVDLHNWIADTWRAPSVLLAGMEALHTDYRVRIDNFLTAYLGTASRPVPFGGRQGALSALDAWLTNERAAPYLLVAGPAGRGKSSLLCHWTRRIVGRPGVDAVFVPISIRFRTNQPAVFLSALCAALAAALHRQQITISDERTPDQWHALAASLMASVPSDRTVVVVLDGLDEAAGWEPGPELFPLDPPRSLRLVVSARHRPCDEDGSGWLATLGWNDPRLGTSLDLQPLDLNGIADVLTRQGGVCRRAAAVPAMLAELARITEGDPLLVRMMADDLRTLSNADLENLTLSLQSIAPGLNGFFKAWWHDQRTLWGAAAPLRERAVQTVLSILAIALGPIGKDELLQLAPPDAGLNSWTLDDALQPLARFVVRSRQGQDLVFAHPRLALFFYGEMTPSECRSWEARLIDWGTKVVGQLTNGDLPPESASRYLIQYYAAHLERSPAHRPLLYSLLSREWRAAWESVERGSAGYLSDLERIWRFSDECNAAACARGLMPPAITHSIRCALYRGSIASTARSLNVGLLEALVRSGSWPVSEAIDAAFQNPNPDVRLTTLLSLAKAAAAPVEQRRVLDAAIATIATLKSDRDDGLAAIIDTALELNLPEHACTAVRALSTESDPCVDDRRDFLFKQVATHVARTDPRAALDIVRDMRYPRHAAWEIAPLLPEWSSPETAVPMAIALGEEFGFETAFRTELLRLLRTVPDPLVSDVCRRLTPLWSNGRITDIDDLYEAVLAILGSRMSAEDQRAELAASRLDRSPRRRVCGLAPYLHADTVDEALDILGSCSSKYVRSEGYASIAPRLVELGRTQEALNLCRTVKYDRADAYFAVAKGLPTQALSDLLDTIEEIDDEALVAVIQGAAAGGHAVLALDRVTRLAEHDPRRYVVVDIVPYLPLQDLSRARQSAGHVPGADAAWDEKLAIRYAEEGCVREALELVALVPAREQYPKALIEAARCATDPHDIGLAVRVLASDRELLAEAAPRIPSDLWPEILNLTSVGASWTRWDRRQVIYPYLDDTQRQALFRMALQDHALGFVEAAAPTLSADSVTDLLNHVPSDSWVADRIRDALHARLATLGVASTESAFRYVEGEATALREAVAAALPTDHLARVLEYALEHKVTKGLPLLIARMISSGQGQVAARICGPSERGGAALNLVAGLLSDADHALILDLAEAMAEEQGASLARAVGEHLPRRLLQRALSLERRRNRWTGRGGPDFEPFVVRLAQLGEWDEAIALARQMDERVRRSVTLGRIAPLLPPERLAELVEMGREIHDDFSRDHALGELARVLLALDNDDRAVTVACAIRGLDMRARTLAAIVGGLSGPARVAAEQECVAAAITSRSWDAEVIEQLVSARCFDAACTVAAAKSHTPSLREVAIAATRAGQIDTAIKATAAISDTALRCRLRARIVTEASAADKAVAITAAYEALEALDYKRHSFTALEQHLTGRSASEIEGALEAALRIPNLAARIQATAILVGTLQEPLRTQRLNDLAAQAAAIRDDESRARVLASIGARLDGSGRRHVVRRALAALDGMTALEDRAAVAAELLPLTDPPDKFALSTLVLDAAERASYDRSGLLMAVARVAPAELLLKLLALAERSDLRRVAATLAERGFSEQTVEWVMSIPDVKKQVEGFCAAAQTPRPETIATLLGRACALPAGDERGTALASLAPFLSDEQRRRAIDAARADGLPPDLGKAMLALLPALLGPYELPVLQLLAGRYPLRVNDDEIGAVVPAAMLEDALELARAAVEYPHSSESLLEAIAPHVGEATKRWIEQERAARAQPTPERPPLQTMIPAMKSSPSCAAVCAAISKQVDEPDASHLWRRAMTEAQAADIEDLAELACQLGHDAGAAFADRVCASLIEQTDTYSYPRIKPDASIAALARGRFIVQAATALMKQPRSSAIAEFVNALSGPLDAAALQAAVELRTVCDYSPNPLEYLVMLRPFVPIALRERWRAAVQSEMAGAAVSRLASKAVSELMNEELAERSLEVVAQEKDLRRRALYIEELAPYIADTLLDAAAELLTAARDERSYDDGDRGEAVRAVAFIGRYAAPPRGTALLREALRVSLTIRCRTGRLWTPSLLKAFLTLPSDDWSPLLRDELHGLAVEGRPPVLDAFAGLTPALQRCGPEAVAESAKAIREATEWWP